MTLEASPNMRQLDYHQVVSLLPYRAPWLLIDRVLDWRPGYIVVQKAITGADPIIDGHLTSGPSIAPGVLLIELVGQAVALLVRLTCPERNAAMVMARCKSTFASPAFIGDALVAEVKVLEEVGDKIAYEGSVRVGTRLICQVSGLGARLQGEMSSSAFSA